MVDRDEFDMAEDGSDNWYASLVDTEMEIQSIVNLDPPSKAQAEMGLRKRAQL